MINISHYKDMLQQPWGKIQYDITFAQLAHLEDLDILDFGAGFGLVSQFLSQKNRVTAVEPEADLLLADDHQTFTKIIGSLEALEDLPSQTFDVICCHNVLEYIEPSQRPAYIQDFERLLRPGGRLSIIKHNQVGKVLQSVVLNNDIETALGLLEGEDFKSLSFAQGKVYSLSDLEKMSQLTIDNYLAIRSFYSLQPNHFKTEKGWLEKMTQMEPAVCDLKPYKDISFLQHVWMRKE